MAPKKTNSAKDSKSKDTKGKDTKGKDTKGKDTKTKDAKSKSTTTTETTSTSTLKPANSINARHILCAKHSRKEEALAQLRAGSKFDDVARDFSEDKARQGGALGWRSRGSLLAEFERAAYALEVSTVANPVWVEVKTAEGYHVVMVEGRK